MNTKPESRKNFWRVFLIFNLIALPALFLTGRYVESRRLSDSEKKLPVYGSLRPFGLVTQENSAFTQENLRGRVWVANFMFTSCPNECPAMNFKMSLLQAGLAQENTGLLSFSVDPSKDTPEVLSGYAERFKAQKGEWYFLTGAKAVIGQLLEDCHFAKADDPLLHGLRLVLIDGDGRVRGYYDYTDELLVKKLSRDIQILKKKG